MKSVKFIGLQAFCCGPTLVTIGYNFRSHCNGEIPKPQHEKLLQKQFQVLHEKCVK